MTSVPSGGVALSYDELPSHNSRRTAADETARCKRVASHRSIRPAGRVEAAGSIRSSVWAISDCWIDRRSGVLIAQGPQSSQEPRPYQSVPEVLAQPNRTATRLIASKAFTTNPTVASGLCGQH